MWDAEGDVDEDDDGGGRAYDDAGGGDGCHGDSDDELDEEMMVALYSQVHHQHNADVLTSSHGYEKETGPTFLDTSTGDFEFSVQYVGDSDKPNTADSNGQGVTEISISKSHTEGDAISSKAAVDSATQSEFNFVDLTSPCRSRSTAKECDYISISSETSTEKDIRKSSVKRNERERIKQWVLVEEDHDGSSDDDDDNGQCVDISSDDDEDVVLSLVDRKMGEDDIIMNTENMPHDAEVIQKVTWQGSKNLDIENMTLEEIHRTMPDNNWDLVPEDRFPTFSLKKRYYSDMKIHCRNCNEKGHLSKCCPKPKKAQICCLCGDSGHLARKCPQSLCHNCHQPGHDMRGCQEPRRRWYQECFRCNLQGHSKKECPDHWRQYHITIKPGPVISHEQKENKKMFCYNCGGKGHFGYDCIEEMMDRYIVPSIPFVSVYDGQRTGGRDESDSRSKQRKKGKTEKRKREADSEEQQNFHKSPKTNKKRKLNEYSRKIMERQNEGGSQKKGKRKKLEQSTVGDFPRHFGEENSLLTFRIHNEKAVSKKKPKKKKQKRKNIVNETETDQHFSDKNKKKKKKKKNDYHSNYHVNGNRQNERNDQMRKTGKVNKRGKRNERFVSHHGFHCKFNKIMY